MAGEHTGGARGGDSTSVTRPQPPCEEWRERGEMNGPRAEVFRAWPLTDGDPEKMAQNEQNMSNRDDLVIAMVVS